MGPQAVAVAERGKCVMVGGDALGGCGGAAVDKDGPVSGGAAVYSTPRLPFSLGRRSRWLQTASAPLPPSAGAMVGDARGLGRGDGV